MVVEWIRVRVAPGARDDFVKADREVWTAGLSQETGFLGKEVWLGEDERDLVLVIRWRREEDWKAVPEERLKELERRFRDAFHEPYQTVETLSCQPACEVEAGAAERSTPEA